jgi:putative transposase
MKYGGLSLTELRELRQLREENSKLMRLVADLTLDRRVLQEIIKKRSKRRAASGPHPMEPGHS